MHDLAVAHIDDPRSWNIEVNSAGLSTSDPVPEDEDALSDATEYLRTCLEHLPVRVDFTLPPLAHA
jgi:hypothetical protein